MSSIEEIYKIVKIKHSRRLNLVTGLYILFLASFCFALTQSLSNYYFFNFLILVGMISLYFLNFKVFRDSIKEKFLSELKARAKYLIIAFVAFLVVNTSFFFFIKHTKSHVSLIIKDEKRVHAKMDSEKVTVEVDDDCLYMYYDYYNYNQKLGLFKNKIHIEYIGADKITINDEVIQLNTVTKPNRPSTCKIEGNMKVFNL